MSAEDITANQLHNLEQYVQLADTLEQKGFGPAQFMELVVMANLLLDTVRQVAEIELELDEERRDCEEILERIAVTLGAIEDTADVDSYHKAIVALTS